MRNLYLPLLMCLFVGFSACKKKAGGILEVTVSHSFTKTDVSVHCHDKDCEARLINQEGTKYIYQVEEDGELHVKATSEIVERTTVPTPVSANLPSFVSVVTQQNIILFSGSEIVSVEKGERKQITLSLTRQ